jgi:hypothetical protein
VISQISILRDAFWGFSGVACAPKGAAPWPLETIGVTVGACALQAMSNFDGGHMMNRAEIIAGLRGGLANECSDAADLIEHLHLVN